MCAPFDDTRTEWDRFYIEQPDGSTQNFITGDDRGTTHVDPTYTVRLGGEYLFLTEASTVSLRAGLFSDPEPSEGSPQPVYGAAVGAGAKLGDFLLDLAYQFRWGNNVRDQVIGAGEMAADLREHHLFFSMIHHF